MSLRNYDEEPTVIVERRTGSGSGMFLAGLAIGAGLALLMAPQSGTEFRRHLRRSARLAQRSANELAREVRERAEDVYAGAREEVESRVTDARETLRDRRRDMKDAVRSGREAAREARVAFERRLSEARAGKNSEPDETSAD
jgi:gas vesicle protein